MSDRGPTPDEATPAVSAAGATPPPVGEGPEKPWPVEKLERLGRYVVLERIGSGGMGVVYAAYDPRLDRKIALKLLHRGDGSSGIRRRIEARLLREAQALARLADPHVVTVFDIGSIGSRIFVAMEYVPGSTLLEWLREAPRSLPEIRRVFQDAGRGLAAAHEAGLVHRDVKASNVMVRQDGEVRVLDFGLARLDGAEGEVVELGTLAGGASATGGLATGTCGVLGTPSYMAPEQMAGGPVGPAADLFSFCVTMYQALYGVSPHRETRDPELPEDWQVQPPPNGSRVPSWIFQALARGLSFRPEDRPASMRHLLRELHRDPWRVRRRWLVALAAGVLLTVGLVAGRDAIARRDQLCQGGEAKLAGVWDRVRRQELTDAFGSLGTPSAGFAARSVAALFDRYRERWLAMYTSACQATHLLGEQSPELLDRRMICLDKRRRELGAMGDLLIQSPGDSLWQAVEAAGSLAPLEICADASTLMAPLALPEDPSVREPVAAVEELLASARAMQGAGRFAEGLEIARRAVSEAEEIRHWPQIAEARLQLGRLLEVAAEAENASAAFESALLAAEAGGHDRVVAEVFIRLARVAGFLQADAEKGREYTNLGAAVLARLGSPPELEAELADHRGLIDLRRGELEAAVGEHRRAVELRAAADGNPVARARSHMRLGTALKELGKFDEANRELVSALESYEAILGPDHPEVAAILDRIGALALDVGAYEKARQSFQRALEIYDLAFGQEHTKTADTLVHLGTVFANLGDLEAAMVRYRRAEEIYRGTEGALDTNLAVILNNIGSVLTEQGYPGEALEVFRRAYQIHLDSLGPDHLLVGFSLYNLGEAHNELGAYETALASHRKALEIWTSQLGGDHYLIAHGRLGEGRALIGLRRFREAEAVLRLGLELWPATGRDPAFGAETEFQLGRALWALGLEEQARGRVRSARDALSASPGHSRRLWQAVDGWMAEHPEPSEGESFRARSLGS